MPIKDQLIPTTYFYLFFLDPIGIRRLGVLKNKVCRSLGSMTMSMVIINHDLLTYSDGVIIQCHYEAMTPSSKFFAIYGTIST